MSLINNHGNVTFNLPLEVVITDALHTAPLAQPPPLLYAAIMRQVRAHPRQPLVAPFRIAWLDLALSLFGASMLVAFWLAWRLTPLPLSTYLRLQVIYNIQRLWYLDSAPLLWIGLGLLTLLAALTAAAITAPSRRF
jgi:hypothetical protein